MKKLPLFFAVISLSILFIFSCKKDKPDVATVDYGSNNSLRTTVTGIVIDESNAPLNGVTVTAYGQTTSTNQYGTFVLKNLDVNKERCVLQFVKTGFFKRAHGFIAAGNTVNYVRIILLSNTATQNFSSSAGGTVSLPDGSSAAFQPNSFVTSNGIAYTGTINLIVKHLSPDDVNFGFTIPGGDLLGKDLNNKDVVLYTYGMLGVELTGSSGEALQLANGTSSTLTLSIAASQLATAPATIPLWFFDETTSLWKEEGTANKVGNNYVGTVAHFSWWNCDYSGPRAYLKGKVVDCNGILAPNVVVSLNGIAEVTTDQNGQFNDWIPSGLTMTIQLQVLSINNGGAILNSQLENIPTLSNNETFTVPDLIVPCPTRIAGTIMSCTGETTEGFVSLTNNSNFNTYQYTLDGTFNLASVPNAQINLRAFNFMASHTQSLTTLSAPAVLNVGTIMLCDTITTSSNYFILNGAGFSNQIFNIIIDNHGAYISDSPFVAHTMIGINGNSFSPLFGINFYLNIEDTVVGPSTAMFNIHMIDSTTADDYQIYSWNFSCNLTQVGLFGNRIKGNFSDAILIEVNAGNPTTGNISGSFDLLRTQ